MRKSKEGEKCRLSEGHLETSLVAVGGKETGWKGRLKNPFSVASKWQIQNLNTHTNTPLCD